MESKQNGIFEKPITDIIKSRISVRTYDAAPMEEHIKDKLTSYLDKLTGPFNGNVRFKIVDTKTALDKDIKLGTYGIIRGVSSFVAAACSKEDMSLEELGYELEKFILYAASLGIGTCWLGGTFKKGEFAKAVELKEDELLPIVTPIGYPAKSKSLVESLMRRVAGSNSRKSWDEMFFNGSFDKSLSEAEAGIYAAALEMLSLAPSASNKQPWRIVKDNDKLHFYICHAKGYSSALGFDMQRIDIGIASCHLELTLKEMGIEGSWQKREPNIKPLNDSTEYVISWIK